jgi:hypothetical protein
MLLLRSVVRWTGISIVVLISIFNLATTDASTQDILLADGCSIHSSVVYLPLIVSNKGMAYFDGPWEVEPNNSYVQANGPIKSGSVYQAYPNDQKDYFSVFMPTDGTISIKLSGNLGQGVQLQLFYQSVSNRVGFDPFSPYEISYNGNAGWYYIYIFKESGYNSNAPYTLQATYPNQSFNSTFRLSNSLNNPYSTSTYASWVGYYNFENSIEDWVTSEGSSKLASLSTTTDKAYAGSQSLKLTTELCNNGNEVYRHTEANAYFTSAVPQGMNKIGPYDLTGQKLSCYVYLPSELVSVGNPQAFVRIFAKDDQFINQFGDLVDIVSSNTDKWINLSLTIDKTKAEPNFDTTKINTLGLRFELYDGATLNFSGDIYIDECTISPSWVGYNFENSIEDWVTSEDSFKLASLSTTTDKAYAGSQSLRLTTELCNNGNEVYRHTEANAYFTSAVPQGVNKIGPYDLTGQKLSCYVYLPSELVSVGNPQAFVRSSI